MQEDLKNVSPDNSVGQNREIKFRAFDKTHAAMYNNICTDWDAVYFRWDKDWRSKKVWIEIIIMQYTWLKDKNWVEIYEGDICKVLYTDRPSKNSDFEWTIDDWKIYKSRTLVVHYDFNWFYFSTYIGWYSEYMNVWKYWQIIIIWNIYQNPEFLSEK